MITDWLPFCHLGKRKEKDKERKEKRDKDHYKPKQKKKKKKKKKSKQHGKYSPSSVSGVLVPSSYQNPQMLQFLVSNGMV